MAEISVEKTELNSFGRFSVILAWAETFRRHRVLQQDISNSAKHTLMASENMSLYTSS
jgi:hypothetical protein